MDALHHLRAAVIGYGGIGSAHTACIARGEVEPRHWRRLGRMLMGDNDYSGMASWTGTMFEYFMPNLLMPSEPNSFLFESLSFCVYAQKRRGARTKTPWGISESGFYAFGPGLNSR